MKSCIIDRAMTIAAEDVYGLAFETSTALGCVALGQGNSILESRSLSGPRQHAVEFLPTVAAICSAHDVEPASVRRVFVSCGPGSFTGLRIGVTAARMIALATGASIVGVPTLEVIAQNALNADLPPPRVVVVLDAKRRRVYTAAFLRQGDRYVTATHAVEADPGEFLLTQKRYGKSCAVLGEGVLYHRSAIEESGVVILDENLYPPSAETVYRLGAARAREGKYADRRAFVPTYVRLPEAEEKWRTRQKSS